ncbi:MAG: hypothetical protein CML98_08210 [Rhodobiaceae bacterium]|nr:hypothetical protein [Rhodobiaceae bacterium]|tara:strand:- start:23075 stop:24763 length:1689 start_codon:yes stop_codon:yes gene_type:complete
MSSRGLLAGYRVAGAGQAPIVDLSAKADEVAKYKMLSDQVTYERQKAFDDERKQFKMDMADAYDETIYEDNFDDTGIADLDAAGTKLQGQVKQSYIENQYAYDQGLIDEATYKSRSNKLKSELNQLGDVIKDVNTAADKYKELEESGDGNAVNGKKLDMLENLMQNFRVTRGPNGLALNTIRKKVDADGNETEQTEEVSLGLRNFKDLLDMNSGFDSTTAVENIVKRGGFVEELKGYGRGAIKITDFTRSETSRAVIDAEVDQMSNKDKLDYLIKKGLVKESDVDEADIFSKENIKKYDDKVAEALTSDLDSELKFKQKKELEDDKFALAKYDADLRASNKQKPPKVQVSVREEIGDDKGDVVHYSVTDPEGVKFTSLATSEKMVDRYKKAVELSMKEDGTLEDVPEQFFTEDVFKSLSIRNMSNNLDKGFIEIDFTYNLPEAGQDVESKSMFGKNYADLDDTQKSRVDQQIKAQASRGGVKGGSNLQRGSLQLDPIQDFNTINDIRAVLGLKSLSNIEREQLRKNRAAKAAAAAAGGGGAGGSFGSKYSGATGQTDSQRQN